MNRLVHPLQVARQATHHQVLFRQVHRIPHHPARLRRVNHHRTHLPVNQVPVNQVQATHHPTPALRRQNPAQCLRGRVSHTRPVLAILQALTRQSHPNRVNPVLTRQRVQNRRSLNRVNPKVIQAILIPRAFLRAVAIRQARAAHHQVNQVSLIQVNQANPNPANQSLANLNRVIPTPAIRNRASRNQVNPTPNHHDQATPTQATQVTANPVAAVAIRTRLAVRAVQVRAIVVTPKVLTANPKAPRVNPKVNRKASLPAIRIADPIRMNQAAAIRIRAIRSRVTRAAADQVVATQVTRTAIRVNPTVPLSAPIASHRAAINRATNPVVIDRATVTAKATAHLDRVAIQAADHKATHNQTQRATRIPLRVIQIRQATLSHPANHRPKAARANHAIRLGFGLAAGS